MVKYERNDSGLPTFEVREQLLELLAGRPQCDIIIPTEHRDKLQCKMVSIDREDQINAFSCVVMALPQKEIYLDETRYVMFDDGTFFVEQVSVIHTMDELDAIAAYDSAAVSWKERVEYLAAINKLDETTEFLAIDTFTAQYQAIRDEYSSARRDAAFSESLSEFERNVLLDDSKAKYDSALDECSRQITEHLTALGTMLDQQSLGPYERLFKRVLRTFNERMNARLRAEARASHESMEVNARLEGRIAQSVSMQQSWALLGLLDKLSQSVDE